MNCAIIQPTIQYIEDIVSTIYPHPFDSHMPLECVYPPGVNKYARCVVRQCVLMMHVAIWTHRNKVIFVKNYVSENAIKKHFLSKLKTFLQVTETRDLDYGLVVMWNFVQENM